MSDIQFSTKLGKWLSGSGPKTLHTLLAAFKEKSFAVLFLVLMAVPALPLPTGGITHVFEIITALIAVELLLGRQEVWLPARWQNLPLHKSYQTSAIGTLCKVVRFAERYSRPRLRGLLKSKTALRVMGLVVLVFTASAFLAPPFSGLDTLPALGVVLLSLAIILEDIVLGIAGLAVGATGIGAIILLGRVALRLF